MVIDNERRLAATAVVRGALAKLARQRRSGNYRRAPRGMGGSGLPFARHDGLPNRPFADDYMHHAPFALRKAVRVGPHSFSKNDLREMFRVNPRALNPITRRALPNRVRNRYVRAPSGPSMDEIWERIGWR